jgi:leucyl aminopeptidase
MIDLPDFKPLKIVQSSRRPTRASLDALDHVVVVVPPKLALGALRILPQGRQLELMLTRARTRGAKTINASLSSSRSTEVTVAVFDATSAFGSLTWARRLMAECLRGKPAKLGVIALDPDAQTARRALLALVAAAEAAAFALPSFKTDKKALGAPLRSMQIFASEPRLELRDARAQGFGNNVARWFTALPPNELSATSYRKAIDTLIKPYPITSKFLGERELTRLKAGAFLAVAQGSAARDAGIAHLSYRPARSKQAAVALVGKGVLFDTGGTNLKPFKGMLDMHTDMQGSAVALGVLLALAELQVPYAVDAWLAITENRLSASAYKSQDVVYAANGTSIQVIHTDAEGRMVLADALALAARAEPAVIIDYATLTGSCVAALTDQYSGVFSNRAAADRLLIDTGIASGERVWPFPMDADFDELLKSEIADIKQCVVDNDGDHILAARFLNRFVPEHIPWIHVDLSAGQHKGGLAHVPSDITGFGVRFTLELLCNHAPPEELARRLSA